jgi:uncharacterized protein YecE (DUF72 family)
MGIRVGTSGWNYPNGPGTWNGIFYPARRWQGFDELAYYAEHFDTVEVNSTFYRMPSPAISARWLARTPAAFEFSVKLYQKFTHPDMYVQRPGVSDWTVTPGDLDEFRAGIDPIAGAGRLAAILLQFPSSFHADEDALGYLDWLLTALSDYPLAVEVRHRSWNDRATEARRVLAAHRAARVRIDEPRFEDSIVQDFSIAADDSTLYYVRLHGRNAATWWTHEHADYRYDYLYRPQELQPFAEAAKKASVSGRRVVLYLNNHFSAKAVANAAVLKHQLGDLVPGDYPREMLDRYPDLNGVVATSGLPL